jgi:hypothetical protein
MSPSSILGVEKLEYETLKSEIKEELRKAGFPRGSYRIELYKETTPEELGGVAETYYDERGKLIVGIPLKDRRGIPVMESVRHELSHVRRRALEPDSPIRTDPRARIIDELTAREDAGQPIHSDVLQTLAEHISEYFDIELKDAKELTWEVAKEGEFIK